MRMPLTIQPHHSMFLELALSSTEEEEGSGTVELITTFEKVRLDFAYR